MKKFVIVVVMLLVAGLGLAEAKMVLLHKANKKEIWLDVNKTSIYQIVQEKEGTRILLKALLKDAEGKEYREYLGPFSETPSEILKILAQGETNGK